MPKHLYAMHVDKPHKLGKFLAEGGDVNDVPVFLNVQDEVSYSVFCFPWYLRGDYGQAQGPRDPTDFDQLLCGAEEMGTRAFAGGQRTLLHWAAYFHNVESVKMLIKSGADTTARSSNGYTPLDIAKFVGAPKEILAMLQYDHEPKPAKKAAKGGKSGKPAHAPKQAAAPSSSSSSTKAQPSKVGTPAATTASAAIPKTEPSPKTSTSSTSSATSAKSSADSANALVPSVSIR